MHLIHHNVFYVTLQFKFLNLPLQKLILIRLLRQFVQTLHKDRALALNFAMNTSISSNQIE